MLSEYGITELEFSDNTSRDELLSVYPYTVILEGGFMEFDSLNKWIEINLGSDSIQWLVYGKTGYDYGFAEYFFRNEFVAQKVSKVVSNIYTVYPNSYPPNRTTKSNGYDQEIIYNSMDKNAIIFRSESNDN